MSTTGMRNPFLLPLQTGMALQSDVWWSQAARKAQEPWTGVWGDHAEWISSDSWFDPKTLVKTSTHSRKVRWFQLEMWKHAHGVKRTLWKWMMDPAIIWSAQCAMQSSAGFASKKSQICTTSALLDAHSGARNRGLGRRSCCGNLVCFKCLWPHSPRTLFSFEPHLTRKSKCSAQIHVTKRLRS